MTVKEFVEQEGFDLDDIHDKADNPYWDSVVNFITEVWNRHIEGLTPKQFNWIHKIVEDLGE